MTMRAHKLKMWPAPFKSLKLGGKNCDLRFADRDYRVGDYVMFVEFDPAKEALTGDYECREITHITTGDNVPRGLIDGFVILSLDMVVGPERDALLGQESMFGGSVEWQAPMEVKS